MTRTNESSLSAETREALGRLGVVAMTLACLMLLTYQVPNLHRFRPWVPGEPPPLSSLFTKWEELPTFAGAGGGYRSTQRTRARVREELGAAVEANLGDASGVAKPSRSEASHSKTSRSKTSNSKRSARPSNLPPVYVDPEEYAGIDIFISDPTGRGMRPFYKALLRTALGKPRAMTRITHYGDSSIATDLITHTARRQLQVRFGDGGHGFILVAKGYLPYRHRDVYHRASDGWVLRELLRRHDRTGFYGLGGIQFRGRPGAWARFGTDEEAPVGNAVSRFDVYFQRHERGGDLLIRVDDDDPRTLETRSEAMEDAVERIEVPDGPHRLELRFGGRGQPRVYGVVLERNGPGVVYDSIGLVGARAARLLNYDATHIAGQLRRRETDLLILGFGGNEASDKIKRETYESDYVQVIRRMRAGREELGCLVFAPLDQAERDERGRIVTFESVPDIVEAQRSAAEHEGCAFYDTWAAMGGEGGMARWYKSRPRLALDDFRHATPAGYEVLGNMLYKALLKGFAEWLSSADHDRDN